MRCFYLLMVWLGSAPLLLAQSADSSAMGLNAAFIRLFDGHPQFTARAMIRTFEKNKETLSMPMELFLLDGSLRAEADLSLMKSSEIVEGSQAMLKEMGMDKVITLLLPTKKNMLIIYPNLKAYADMPMPEEEVTSFGGRVQKQKVGQETVGDRKLDKWNYTVTAEGAAPVKTTVWTDPGLGNFPVRIVLPQEDVTVEMTLSNIKKERPSSQLFAVPTGFTRYTDAEEMIQKITVEKLKGK